MFVNSGVATKARRHQPGSLSPRHKSDRTRQQHMECHGHHTALLRTTPHPSGTLHAAFPVLSVRLRFQWSQLQQLLLHLCVCFLLTTQGRTTAAGRCVTPEQQVILLGHLRSRDRHIPLRGDSVRHQRNNTKQKQHPIRTIVRGDPFTAQDNETVNRQQEENTRLERQPMRRSQTGSGSRNLAWSRQQVAVPVVLVLPGKQSAASFNNGTAFRRIFRVILLFP